MSCGEFTGFDASDMMQNGFFWYSVPMTLSEKPFWTAAPAEKGRPAQQTTPGSQEAPPVDALIVCAVCAHGFSSLSTRSPERAVIVPTTPRRCGDCGGD